MNTSPMTVSRIFAAVLLVSLTALPAAFAKPMQSHGATVHGTIASLNASGKTLAIQEKNGKSVDVTWTDATKVNHGPLQNGEQATVRYMTRDGKNVATVINIAPPAKKTAAKATTTSSSTKSMASKTTAKH